MIVGTPVDRIGGERLIRAALRALCRGANEKMGEITIREYRSSDAADVSEVIRTTMRISNSADYSMDRLQPLIDYFSPERVQALNAHRVCFVAEDSGRIVGTGGVEGDELVTLFVLPDRQHSGIGSSLLAAIEAAAREEGVSHLRVGASLAGATFYERHGYEKTGAVLEGVAGAHISLIKPLR